MTGATTHRPAEAQPAEAQPDAARLARARALTAGIQHEYPFEPHFLEVDGGALHYLDEGPRDGETLLCVHGNPTWSFYFRRLAREFSDRRRVVAVDHIGCGLSDKPQDWGYRLADHVDNLVRLVETLDLRAITLVVHDWGGAIGFGMAARCPERIARLVITNTAAFPGGRVPLRIELCRIPGLGEVLLRGLNGFARAATVMAVSDRKRMRGEVRRGYLAPYSDWQSRIAHWRFVRDIPKDASHPSYATLAAIGEALPQFDGRPAAIFWGERDFCFTPRFRERWQEILPSAEVNAFEDSGHYVLEDAHERILPRLADFMERNPSA